jgi:hypothetical protein
MDPFTITTGIIGTTAIAIHSARRLKEFIDSIQGAPETVHNLSEDVEALRVALQSLHDLMHHGEVESNPAQKQFLKQLHAPLQHCNKACNQIEEAIRPLTKLSDTSKSRKWKRALLWTKKKNEILTLQNFLVSYKSSLDIAINSANLSTSTAGFANVKKQLNGLHQQLVRNGVFEGCESIAEASMGNSDNIGTDHGFILRRYFLEAESLVGGSGPPSPVLEPDDGSSIADKFLSTSSLPVTELDRQLSSITVTSAEQERGSEPSDTLSEATPEPWTPDCIVGVDFGMTSTGVAYSYGPEWQVPETIRQWPEATGTGFADKVATAISYDVLTDRVEAWGFAVDPDQDNCKVEQLFKLWLDPDHRDRFGAGPGLEQARRWFTDYLACIYTHINEHLTEVIPKWQTRHVEFVFSVPATWKDPAMIAFTERLIRDAGFGTRNRHLVEISLTDAEAAGVYVAKQGYEKDDVFLICDAGGGTTDVNILKVSESHLGQVELEPLAHVEGRPIGSTNIDAGVQNLITKRLELIRQHLSSEPRAIAERMTRTRKFDDFKCSFASEASDAPKLSLHVPGLQTGHDFMQAHIEDSKMIITKEELQKVFNKQIEQIFRLVDEELKNLRTSHKGETVSYLILSGGLGSSPYVQKELRMRYEMGTGSYANAPDLKVLMIAPKPHLAVVHGLVMDRVQRIREERLIYKERYCRNSYGIVTRQVYSPKRHQGERTMRDPRDRKLWVINQIDWFIKKVSNHQLLISYCLT